MEHSPSGTVPSELSLQPQPSLSETVVRASASHFPLPPHFVCTQVGTGACRFQKRENAVPVSLMEEQGKVRADKGPQGSPRLLTLCHHRGVILYVQATGCVHFPLSSPASPKRPHTLSSSQSHLGVPMSQPQAE